MTHPDLDFRILAGHGGQHSDSELERSFFIAAGIVLIYGSRPQHTLLCRDLSEHLSG